MKNTEKFRVESIPKGDLRRITKGIDVINSLSLEAQGIPEAVKGDHRDGHRRINDIYRRANPVMERKMSDDKTLREYLKNDVWNFRYNGFRVMQYGFPIPQLRLVKGFRYYDNAYVIRKFISGSERACHHFLPVSQIIMTDNSHTLYLDAVSLEKALNASVGEGYERRWHIYDAQDLFSKINLNKRYHLEKSGLFELSLMANQLGMPSVLKAFNLKIYSDLLMSLNGTRVRRFPLPESFERMVFDHAWRDEVPGSLLEKRGISERTHEKITRELTEQVVKPLREIFDKPLAAGGIIPMRAFGSILLGASKGCPPVDRPEAVHALEVKAEQMVKRFTRIIEKNISSAGRKGGIRHLPVDVADLESNSQARKWMSAGQMNTAFDAFMTSSGIRETYEVFGTDVSDCPMPYAGPPAWPIEGRSKAAAMSQLISDIGPGVALDLPFYMFGSLRDLEDENDPKAVKAMMEKMRYYFNQWLTLQRIEDSYPTRGLVEAWVGFFEYLDNYMGCGVSSLTDILWRLFFASEKIFEAALTHEDACLGDRWRSVRGTLAGLREKIKARDWRAVKKGLDRIFKEVKWMGLHVTDGLDSDDEKDEVAPFSYESVAPFSAPENHFSRKILQAKYSRSPIEIVEAPPGNKDRYEKMVRRSMQQISMLKRAQAQPLEETANLVGYARTGPIFDFNRMHLLPLGHCLFSTVSYHPPQPCPGMKIQVVFLMDMSGSMNDDRVREAKAIGLIMTEGLMGRFDVDFYMYNTAGSFYRLTLLMKSSNRRLGGKAALSTITRKGLECGDGWNPDAAVLSCISELYRKETSGPTIICLIGDQEYCSSLMDGLGCETAIDEMEMVAREMLKDERFHFVVCRVGRDEDPFSIRDLRHHYIHIPDDSVSDETMVALYRIIETCATAHV